jgi:hypothetical protein
VVNGGTLLRFDCVCAKRFAPLANDMGVRSGARGICVLVILQFVCELLQFFTSQ